MILIINICKERLHYYEFVKPICDILDNNKIRYFVKSYKEINRGDLEKCSKIIISGTSLYDNEFVLHSDKFKWILDFSKPLLGICGGMQIIGLLFNGKMKEKTEEDKNFLKKKTEIGFYFEDFKKNFLGLTGKEEVYHLHNYFVDFSKLPDFDILCGKEIPISHSDLVNSKKKISKSKCSQAIKHKEKEIYGVLFHPEVRQKKLIFNFCRL